MPWSTRRVNRDMLQRSLPKAARLEWNVPNNVDAKYWKRLREAFMRCITERDFIGCLIVQEIMLESFAVASYARVGKAAPGSLGQTFAGIAAEEEDHIEHAMEILRAERARDPQRFDDKSLSAASGRDDHSRGDGGQRMQGMDIANCATALV